MAIDQHPRAAISVVGAATVIAVIAIVMQLQGPSTPKPPTNGFYTVDDGATYYKDSLTNVPPYDHDGKKAVRALVIVGANGKTFVASLLRFSAKQKALVDSMIAKNPDGDDTLYQLRNGLDEIKPAQSPNAKWVTLDSGAGRAAAIFKTPPDVTTPTEVLDP